MTGKYEPGADLFWTLQDVELNPKFFRTSTWVEVLTNFLHT